MIKEHPILFSGEMVRAILDGRKTQTRRVISYRRPWAIENDYWPHDHPLAPYAGNWPVTNTDEGQEPLSCLYGVPGDLLWVRETWQDLRPHQERVVYAATSGDVVTKWRLSIHMPRWASRITLRVVNVRVERLHDISEADAKAEGVMSYPGQFDGEIYYQDYSPDDWNAPQYTARESFCTLWDSINAARGFGWNANPWVWVVEFEKVQP